MRFKKPLGDARANHQSRQSGLPWERRENRSGDGLGDGNDIESGHNFTKRMCLLFKYYENYTVHIIIRPDQLSILHQDQNSTTKG